MNDFERVNMMILYGIPNCDTMKKARAWLAEHAVEYQFHNYKKSGLDEATLRGWVAQVGWELLLNRRGMMWRKVSDAEKAAINEVSAIRLMLETPSMIKRPVLQHPAGILVGFKPAEYADVLTQQGTDA